MDVLRRTADHHVDLARFDHIDVLAIVEGKLIDGEAEGDRFSRLRLQRDSLERLQFLDRAGDVLNFLMGVKLHHFVTAAPADVGHVHLHGDVITGLGGRRIDPQIAEFELGIA